MQLSSISAKRTRWGEKPYYSLDYYYKELFGEKVYKIALDAQMTCPNRDGTIHNRGCIFCSNGGSGDFATPYSGSISSQIEHAITFLQKKGKKTGDKFIAYFQSFSNTYAPVEYLEEIFTQAMKRPDIVGLSIATRPDCFSPEIYALLEKLQKKKPVWVELTSHVNLPILFDHLLLCGLVKNLLKLVLHMLGKVMFHYNFYLLKFWCNLYSNIY